MSRRLMDILWQPKRYTCCMRSAQDDRSYVCHSEGCNAAASRGRGRSFDSAPCGAPLRMTRGVPHAPLRMAGRATSGFTLTELLAALLIVVMLTGMVATGVAVGNKLYRQSAFQSQSEVLIGTIDSALRTPFQTLEKSAFEDDFYSVTCLVGEDSSKVYGTLSGTGKIDLILDDDMLYIVGKDADVASAGEKRVKLLNESAYEKMKVTGAIVTYTKTDDAVTTKVELTITSESGDMSTARTLTYKSSKVRTVLEETP